MSIRNDFSDLFASITAETTVITPNRRLSATLHKSFHQFHIDRQQHCWPTLDVLPVFNWLIRLWEEAISDLIHPPLLLNNNQIQYLWEEIIGQDRAGEGLLQISQSAELAIAAWDLLKQWQIPFSAYDADTAEYQAFLRWSQRFLEICQQKNWIDFASLTDLVCKKIETKEIKVANHLIFFAFNECSPQLKTLIKQCEKTGKSVRYFNLKKENQYPKRLSFSDQESEIYTAARWAKSRYEKNPNAKIGCIFPSLDKMRERIAQIFSQVFAPENVYALDLFSCPFNISAGKSLSQYPVIQAALELLSLQKKISITDFSTVLTSVFIGEAEVERVARAEYDVFLKQKNIQQINLDKEVLRAEKYCPRFAKRLQKFLDIISKNTLPKSFSDWAKHFNTLLTHFGFPGERSLNSVEFQTIDQWFKLLDGLMTFDQIGSPVHYSAALQRLKKMATSLIFQPKTKDANIQILGLLEGASLPFDEVWIAQMDATSFPPEAKPNPFIPKILQNRLEMPHANAARELAYCQNLIDQFKQSSEVALFSFAEKREDLPLEASPLIRNFQAIAIEDLDLSPYIFPAEKIYASKKMEAFIDDQAPSIQKDEKIDGGTTILKQQALCPFKAFAEYRLNVFAIEKPLLGMRAKDRGILLHKSLEHLWKRLGDQKTLNLLTHDQRDEIIHRCIDVALIDFENMPNDYKNYCALEKNRLYHLLSAWLDIERERPPFKVIHQEFNTQIQLDPCNISIRIDRIDELEDGKQLIIDYKTGKNNELNFLFGDRIQEPQLPLYAILNPQKNVGVAFAQIYPGQLAFKGVSQYSLDIKGLKLVTEIKKTEAISWQEQLNQWKKSLTQLAEGFYQGIANVDPKEESQTCTRCNLKPLCRIHQESQ